MHEESLKIVIKYSENKHLRMLPVLKVLNLGIPELSRLNHEYLKKNDIEIQVKDMDLNFIEDVLRVGEVKYSVISESEDESEIEWE